MPKGKTGTVQTQRPWRGKICKVDGCERKNYGHGYCNLHYGHWRRGLTPGPSRRPGPIPESTDITCSGAHCRVTALWGRAAKYLCIACGGPAKDWAYDGSDPSQKYGETWSGSGSWQFYSVFPEFYMPMCRQCHAARDKAIQKRELREYREWKLRTGEKDLSRAVVAP